MARTRHEDAHHARHLFEREAADLLAGRCRPEARRLLSLIHEVNPTGRSLSLAETRARYALKASLQSLLVRAFRDDLRVEPAGSDGHTVSLNHRFLRSDACHAVVADLDPDARAWVQWQLDTREEEALSASTESIATRETHAPHNALSLGRAALAAYDYEAARHHLERAVAQVPVAASVLLLELLVDHLGDDEAALRLARELDAQTLGRTEVRARLGLAHARCTQRIEAERLAHTLPAARAVEVYIALGRDALRTEDAAYLRKSLDAARKADATRPEIVSLAEGLKRLEAAERRACEEALLHALSAEDRAELARRAQAILARWPESESARRVLRDLREREQREARAQHLAHAARALAVDHLDTAQSALDAARAHGADTRALDAQLSHAQHAARARREDALVKRVVDALEADPHRAFEAYIELSEPLRARVRALAPTEPIAWIEEITVGARKARPGAVAAAVLALQRALESERRGDYGPAATLAPHDKLLAHCAAAMALARRLDDARKEDRRRTHQTHLAEARAALLAGDALGALRRLDRVDVRALHDPQATEAQALRERIRWRNVLSARADRLARCEARGEPFAAREHARWLTEHTEGAEREEWTAIERNLAARGRAQTRRWETAGGSSEAFLAGRVERCSQVEMWLDPSGREFAFFSFLGRWLFVDVIDVETARSTPCVSMRLPADLGSPRICVLGDRVYILSGEGRVIVLDRTSWEVLAWHADESVIARGSKATSRYLTPDGSQVWYLTSNESRGGATVVVDLKSWTVQREISGDHWLHALPGPRGAWCLFDRKAQRGALLDADGRTLAAVAPHKSQTFHGLVEHPQGRGFLVVCSGDRKEDGTYGELALGTISDDGAFVDLLPLTSHCANSLAVATSREAGCVFATFETPDGAYHLVAVGATADGLAVLYQRRVPARAILITDAGAARVVAVADGYDRMSVVVLGRAEPWALRGRDLECARDTPDAAPPFGCQDVEATTDPVVRKRLEDLARSGPAARRRWLAKTLHDAGESMDPTRVPILLAGIDEDAAALDIADLYAEHFPTDVRLAVLRADLNMRVAQWHKALERLADVPEDDWPAHAWHLAGSAHLYLGDTEAARRHWVRGKALGPNECGIAFCLDLLDASPAGLETSQEVLRDAIDAARGADECAARGDHEGAIRALDRMSVFVCTDPQLHARLAFSCLEHPPRNPREALFHRCVFAELVRQCGADVHTSLGDVLVPGAVWDASRIRAVRDRAVAWLDAPVAGLQGPVVSENCVLKDV